jgi:hypothetical protein
MMTSIIMILKNHSSVEVYRSKIKQIAKIYENDEIQLVGRFKIR